MLMFTLCRFVFYLANFDSFSDVTGWVFIGGLQFDLSAILLMNLPLITLYLLPFPFRELSWYQRILKVLFYAVNLSAIGLNLIDTEYFKFTMKRSTIDLIDLASAGDDLQQLIPVFLRDYWYLILLFIGMIIATEWLYRLTKRTVQGSLFSVQYFGIHLAILALLGTLCVIGSRGGMQPKPVSVIDAAEFTSTRNIPLVLNTPFTMIKSYEQIQLEEVHYFDDEYVKNWFDPVRQYDVIENGVDKPNVVLILLESFSREYVGKYNVTADTLGFLEYFGYQIEGQSYTPFLDSLMEESLYFTHAFANGRKSIEAVPAATASIYTLMNSPYVTSVYSANKLHSLATILAQTGYSTSFYHGATNGSMRFDGYSQAAGYQKYYGRTEYDNNADYDGQWGIWDEEFLQYFQQGLSKEKGPFFSTIFTLTSHHPFMVPERYEETFLGGDLPILRSVQYTDYALSRFFEEAKKQPWFDNTLFVITADHTGPPRTKWSHNQLGGYAIPLIFYHPTKQLEGQLDYIVQQADIMPSVLDFLNYEKPFVAFGESAFRPSEKRVALSYINNHYQLIMGHYIMQWDGEHVKNLYNYVEDPKFRVNLAGTGTKVEKGMKRHLKAMVQSYNTRMIHNQLTVE